MTGMDRRVARTREALRRALVALMLDKGYEAVSVEDICRKAGVGRSTFYTHYKSKDDLKRAGVETIRSELGSHGREAGRGGDGLGFMLPLFRHAREHIDHYRALAGGRGGAVALETIRRTVTDLVRREPVDGFAGEAVPKDFAVQYLVGAFMAVLIWWLDRGAKVAPERLDQMFRAMALRTGRSPGR